MKKVMMILLMLMVVLAMPLPAHAEGVYDATLDGMYLQVVFRAGPFSPGEMGTASVYVDRRFYDSYQY
jgi:hypothetical protein